MKRMQRLILLLVVCCVSGMFAGPDASALTVPKLRLDQTVLTKDNDSDAFVTGTVSVARGQKISAFATDGSTVLARTAVGNSGKKEAFQLRIPAASLVRNGSTEVLIQRGMDALMHGRTTFVIAHRLSTVMNSNAIMVLEQGRIIERGTHEELLEQKGRYYQLYTGRTA